MCSLGTIQDGSPAGERESREICAGGYFKRGTEIRATVARATSEIVCCTGRRERQACSEDICSSTRGRNKAQGIYMHVLHVQAIMVHYITLKAMWVQT